jgi:hypothetical protein
MSAEEGEKCRVLMEKRKENSLLTAPRCKCEHNNKMGLKEMGLEGVDWLDLS